MKTTINFLLFSFIALNSIAWACEDVKVSPKQFYSLTGRAACYAACDLGCGCEYVDMNRSIQLCPKPELPLNCKPQFITFENPTPDLSVRIKTTYCIEERGPDTPPLVEVIPIDDEVVP